MNALKLILIVLASSLSLSSVALAQEDGDRPPRGTVTREQAIRIAQGYGIVRFEELEQDDGGWEIEGRDRQGREVEITINRQGRVTSVERSRNDDD